MHLLSSQNSANLAVLLQSAKKELSLKNQLLAIANQEKQRNLTSLIAHNLHEVGNPYILVYATQKCCKTKKNVALITDLLALLAEEKQENWQATVKLPEAVQFALDNNAPIEYFQATIPYLSNTDLVLALNKLLKSENISLSKLFFNALKNNLLKPEQYALLIETAIEKNRIDILYELCVERNLELIDSHKKEQWLLQLIKLPDHDYAILVERLLNSNVALKNIWLPIALNNKKLKIASLLLKKGANPNVVDERGYAATHHAARYNLPDTLALLHSYGADFYQETINGDTLLDLTQDKTTRKQIERYQLPPQLDSQYEDNPPIHNLVFCGGGVKGRAFVTAIKEAEKRSLFKLNELKGAAGASAGALTALLVSLNYTAEELENTASNMNMLDFIDPVNPDLNEQKEAITRIIAYFSSGLVSGALRSLLSPNDINKAKALINTLMTHKGIIQGEKFLTFIKEQIRNKVKDSSLSKHLKEHPELITFADMQAAGFKDLHVVATIVNNGHVVRYNAETTPDATVADAVRASIAYPFIFTPWKFYYRDKDGVRKIHPAYQDAELMDGGALNNYPIHVFDDEKTGFNPHVLGLYFAGQELKDNLENNISNLINKFDSNMDYFYSLFFSLINQETNNLRETKKHKDRTVYISTNLRATKFDVTPEELASLEQEGAKAIQDYMNRRCGFFKPCQLSKSTLSHLIELGDVNQLKSLHYGTTINSDNLKLSPLDIIKLYANCEKSEVPSLRAIVNPNDKRDENKNTALHLAYAARIKYGELVQRYHGKTEGEYYKICITKLENAISNLLDAHANPNALNNAGKKPTETSGNEYIHSEPHFPLRSDMEMVMEKLNLHNNELIQVISKLQAQLKDKEDQKIEFENRLAWSHNHLKARTEENNHLRKILAETIDVNHLAEKTKDYTYNVNKITYLTSSINQLEQELAEKDKQINHLQSQLDIVTNQSDALSNVNKQISDELIYLRQCLEETKQAVKRLHTREKTRIDKAFTEFNQAIDHLKGHKQTLILEKNSFFSMNKDRKDQKIKGIDELVNAILDPRNLSKPLSDIVTEFNKKYSGALTAGLFGKCRTQTYIEEAIKAEENIFKMSAAAAY